MQLVFPHRPRYMTVEVLSFDNVASTRSLIVVLERVDGPLRTQVEIPDFPCVYQLIVFTQFLIDFPITLDS